MNEKILMIGDREKDLDLIREILLPKGFQIRIVSSLGDVEGLISKNEFVATLADYDFTGERTNNWIGLLQEDRSRSCFILYGDQDNTEKITDLLQIGAYAFIPRSRLSERIHDTLLGGLENRKAFIDILGMMDDLRDVNERLEREKKALRRKNQELNFINRLSSDIAYDLNWDRIIPRILNAGLLNVLDPALLGILYCIGSEWNMALHISEREINRELLEGFKDDMINRFFAMSGDRVSKEEMILHLYPSNVKVSSSGSLILTGQWVLPLSLVGKPLGLLVVHPKVLGEQDHGLRDLISTMSNILVMSLKNAQEYQRLKEMTVKDGLTGVFNRKSFVDFIRREFHRAMRHKKSLAMVMIDVDNFKEINDSLGHQAGDYVLSELAGCLTKSLRSTDIVSRYGGDEFAILLPETDTERAEMLMDRVLSSIKKHPFRWKNDALKVEISFGISTAGELQPDEGEEELISRADSRLYHEKAFKNQTISLAGGG